MARPVEGLRPKSQLIPGLILFHRAALDYDLRTLLGLTVSDIEGGALSWNDAWGLISEVLRRSSSHTRSALAGDRYVPEASEIVGWETFEAWFNTQTKKGSGYRRIKRPWAGKPQLTPVEHYDPEREARRAKIREMTGRPART